MQLVTSCSPPSEVVLHVVQLEDSAAGMLVKVKRAPPCAPSPPRPLPPYDGEEAPRAAPKAEQTASVWGAWPSGGPASLRTSTIPSTDKRQASMELNETHAGSLERHGRTSALPLVVTLILVSICHCEIP